MRVSIRGRTLLLIELPARCLEAMPYTDGFVTFRSVEFVATGRVWLRRRCWRRLTGFAFQGLGSREQP